MIIQFQAKSDNITKLKRFRQKSESYWMFFYVSILIINSEKIYYLVDNFNDIYLFFIIKYTKGWEVSQYDYWHQCSQINAINSGGA